MAANQSKFVNVVVILGLIGFAGVTICLGQLIWTLVGDWQQAAMLADAVPYSNANAIVTSKDRDTRLSVKSAALPKGGDVIDVDRYAYGATSIGDSVCVRYKRLPDEPQHGTEFVSQGSCK
jgi:hypothetical protein